MMKYRLSYNGPSGFDYAGFDTEREAMTWAAHQEDIGLIKALKLMKYDKAEDIYKVIEDLSVAPVVADWELDMVENWTSSEIKNRIWSFVAGGQPIPGSVSVTALRLELLNRGEVPVGYHDT